MNRGTKATLTRTIPRSIFKSSTKDLSFPIFLLVLSLVSQQRNELRLRAEPRQCYDLDYMEKKRVRDGSPTIVYAYAPSM